MRFTEKVVLRYYNDMGKSKGNCTWGPGILAHKGVCSEDELARKVTLLHVETEFDRRVGEAERYVRRAITRTPLNQAQFAALVSLTYNAGVRNMRGPYDLVNQGDFDRAAANISRMVKVSIVDKGKKKEVIAPGLIRRREEESAPFRVKAVSAK
jgi:GH24 family phage-related lysozyme (muramidase)